jgi:hypothetical protein
MFGSVTADGRIDIWDLNISTLDPVVSARINPRRALPLLKRPNRSRGAKERALAFAVLRCVLSQETVVYPVRPDVLSRVDGRQRWER